MDCREIYNVLDEDLPKVRYNKMGERTSLLALPPHNNCLNTKLCPYAITAKKGTPYKSAAKVLILFVI